VKDTVAALGDKQFKVRQKARADLLKLLMDKNKAQGRAVRAYLLIKEADKTISIEVKRRIEALIAQTAFYLLDKDAYLALVMKLGDKLYKVRVQTMVTLVARLASFEGAALRAFLQSKQVTDIKDLEIHKKM
jgi:hypothetical protein